MSNIVDFAQYKRRKEIEHLIVKCEPNKGFSFEEQARFNKAAADRVKAERDEYNRRLKYELGLGDDYEEII